MIHPDLRSREELIDFLRWKGSTHVIDQTNAKRTDRNGLKTTNQATQEKGKNELVKNTRHNLHKLNPEGHKVVRATFPAAKTSSCTNNMNLWTSLTRTLRGAKGRKRKW